MRERLRAARGEFLGVLGEHKIRKLGNAGGGVAGAESYVSSILLPYMYGGLGWSFESR